MTPAATGQEIEQIISSLQLWFDEAITKKEGKANLQNRPLINAFLDKHTYRGKYFFIIKKCSSCDICTEPRLPQALFEQLKFIPVPELDGEHFKPFAVSTMPRRPNKEVEQCMFFNVFELPIKTQIVYFHLQFTCDLS